MNIPAELKYTKDHEWIKVEEDVATIGVTDFAQKELGDIVFIEVETVDETLDKEETFGTIEAVKTVSICLCLSAEPLLSSTKTWPTHPKQWTKTHMAKDG